MNAFGLHFEFWQDVARDVMRPSSFPIVGIEPVAVPQFLHHRLKLVNCKAVSFSRGSISVTSSQYITNG